jgi:hypothetical protein
MKISTWIKLRRVKFNSRRVARIEKAIVNNKKYGKRLQTYRKNAKKDYQQSIMALEEDELLLYGQKVGVL